MDEVVGNTERFTVSYKDLYKDLKAGDIILLDDGYVSVEVKEINGTDIVVNVLNTGRMKSNMSKFVYLSQIHIHFVMSSVFFLEVFDKTSFLS